MVQTKRRFEQVGETQISFAFIVYIWCTLWHNVICMLMFACLVDCRCRPVHTEVSGCCSADRMLLLAEKASVICAETRASGERGKVLSCLLVLHCLNENQSPPEFTCLIGFSPYVDMPSLFSSTFCFSLQDVSELRNELQRKEMLVQKHLSKLHHWQQVLEEMNNQHRKPSELHPPGPLTFLEQASASLPPAPLKPN